MKHTDAPAVKAEDGPRPLYLILRSGTRPPCIFAYQDSHGDAFAADMLAAGWLPQRIDDHLILTAPDTTNVVPFPLAHPLLRGV